MEAFSSSEVQSPAIVDHLDKCPSSPMGTCEQLRIDQGFDVHHNRLQVEHRNNTGGLFAVCPLCEASRSAVNAAINIVSVADVQPCAPVVGGGFVLLDLRELRYCEFAVCLVYCAFHVSIPLRYELIITRYGFIIPRFDLFVNREY